MICTASPSWFSVVVRTLISPWSGRDFDGRTSSTSLSTQLVPGSQGPRPTELVEAGADDAAGGLELSLH